MSVEGLAKQLEKINPYGLGRKTRQFIDDVWERVTEIGDVLGGGQNATRVSDRLAGFDVSYDDESLTFAPYTNVLVVGATGKVGRILVRKLLLRGYKVRVLVRDKEAAVEGGMPPSVEVFEGDIGELDTVQRAMVGISKVVCCARPKSQLTGDLRRVDYVGIANVAKSFLDEKNAAGQKRKGRSPKNKLRLCDFGRKNQLEKWRLVQLGATTFDESPPSGKIKILQKGKGRFAGSDSAALDMPEGKKVGEFTGTVNTRKGVCAFEMDVDVAFDRYDGFTVRMLGDGRQYDFTLKTRDGHVYRTAYNTKKGFQTVRLPFSAYVPVASDSADDVPRRVTADVVAFGVSYINKGTSNTIKSYDAEEGMRDLLAGKETLENQFRFVLDHVKATPAGEEPDVILVSCAGAGIESEETREKVAKYKSLGEGALRNSGLGYTVVRPGELVDEPGGNRALIFDQGDRITQKISCADVADVCLRSMHESTARNKSFEVCFEYDSGSSSMYELVTQVKKKETNYLRPALAVLEENT